MKIPLVLVSGLVSNERVWQHQSRYLSEIADVQIISPSRNTPQKMVREILDCSPPRFALAGHSMGGWLALEVMREAPSRVEKLCLLNTTARGDSVEKSAHRKEMILRAQSEEFSKIVQDLTQRFVFNSAVISDVEKMFLEVGKDAFIRQQEAMLMRSECMSVLKTIRCPTLVIHASRDENFSYEEHEELSRLIPHAKIALVEDSGHMSPMEVPQAITALLRFWLSFF